MTVTSESSDHSKIFVFHLCNPIRNAHGNKNSSGATQQSRPNVSSVPRKSSVYVAFEIRLNKFRLMSRNEARGGMTNRWGWWYLEEPCVYSIGIRKDLMKTGA